ncbi:unnamed protein product [Knipowitschia caucasica]
MMKIRRYLRGSGRVLAFVFVASIIWLIFDMAALRMSINDVNSQLLKERVIREREVFKQQSKMSQVIKNGFGHPVQRVNADGSQVNNEPLKVHRVAENVYRGRKRGPFVGDKKMDSNQVVLPALDDTKAKRQTEKPSKMRVDLDINEKNQFDSKLKTTTKMAAVKSINKGDNGKIVHKDNVAPKPQNEAMPGQAKTIAQLKDKTPPHPLKTTSNTLIKAVKSDVKSNLL